jgi:Asp-tRNA(Asn)/Glu-tRNA(Gln) amidotransferase A subunit family amidase
LRVGVLDGYFQAGASADVLDALEQTVRALPAVRRVEFPDVDRARAAAVCITAAEGGRLHLRDLAARPHDFDVATRDRLIAGALLPATVVLQAQAFRRWFRAQVAHVFKEFDVLLAPVTPCTAPRFDESLMAFRGREVPIRATLGVFTQPLSFIGLPVISAPVNRPGLPTAVQIIAKPWAEATALRFARRLEREGVFAAQIAAQW